MCGLIAAFTAPPVSANAIQRGSARMWRRGQDDEGFWQEGGACLGHRRLAIIDIDQRAAQPMQSVDGRYVIVYNGEIYNYRALRKQLEAGGAVLRTGSDTEVLLALYARDGEAMLPKLRGMFAFVIWDRISKQAFVARDPYGIKPLYLARIAGGWLFASQVKALLATGLVSKEPDPHGQAGFWMLGSVPEPRTWFVDINAVPAGSWCRVDAELVLDGPHTWFDIGDCWREAPDCRMTVAEAQDRVRVAVLDSVRAHLVSDVPVGVFLSGGIDSGSLAGLMRDAGASNIQGVTVAFGEFAGTRNDESIGSEHVAGRYGIRHHIRTVRRVEFEADLPRILDAMDQPSIDGINTWYASKAVAELGLKVVVSGVGGDKLFCGYPSFHQIPALVRSWRNLSKVPGVAGAVNALAKLQARRSGNPRWHWFTREAANAYGAYWLRRGLFSPDQLPDLMSAAPAMDPIELIHAITGPLAKRGEAMVGQLESKAYLRNQLLRDSDWASMDHSVELRTPLVDAWLVRELTPLLRGFGQLRGKSLLANSPATPLPADIITRGKTGFGIPVERWLRETSHGAHIEGGSRGWARCVASRYAEVCE